MSEFSTPADLPGQRPPDVPVVPPTLPEVSIGQEPPFDEDAVGNAVDNYGDPVVGELGVGDVGPWDEPDTYTQAAGAGAAETVHDEPEVPELAAPAEPAAASGRLDPAAAAALRRETLAVEPHIATEAHKYMPDVDGEGGADQRPAKEVPETYTEMPATAEAPHGHSDAYFDEFTAENKAAILEKLDGPDGFFARAEQAGIIEQLDPRIGEAIDRVDDAALETLGVTKHELKTIAAAYAGGQGRCNFNELKVPTEVRVEGTTAHTDVGDFSVDRDLEDGSVTVPRGRFAKSSGELWIVGPQIVERYPDPEQRRIATLWTGAHEFGHGVMAGDLVDALVMLEGSPVTMPDDTPSTTTDQVSRLVNNFPATPITAYAGSYRTDEGKLPSRTEGPIGFAKAVEEEACETAAATLFGFAPTPGRSAQDALNDPYAGREEFQQRVWDYMQAAPRETYY
jgi:hypothetical protein